MLLPRLCHSTRRQRSGLGSEESQNPAMSASISAHLGDLPRAPHVEATGRTLGVATRRLVETEARGVHVASFNLPQTFAFSARCLSMAACLSLLSRCCVSILVSSPSKQYWGFKGWLAFCGVRGSELRLSSFIPQLLLPALDPGALRLPFHFSCPLGTHVTPSGFHSIHETQEMISCSNPLSSYYDSVFTSSLQISYKPKINKKKPNTEA
ncbi:unnamed protein product [Rangifer tarandus platyrhynchus]|uniref:Uncharacterized protein n=2 Tax=Rangifer tarandus platyrhynchus TaxID=3082113 RepID=A0ABN8YJ26_RANTA|nr:unnamed protein product [Rangifer tarandus platyrhynchus]CAI9699073.1 unnamed protein product [Rangifer tarandus platyrhynchus]